MSTTGNSLNGIRRDLVWEQKVIKLVDFVSDDTGFVDEIEPYRDWMLGGEHMEWRYHKDNITGDLILERR